MTGNKFKTEKNEQSLTRPAPNKSRIPWHAPRLDVLKGSKTEHNVGPGADAGSGGSSLS